MAGHHNPNWIGAVGKTDGSYRSGASNLLVVELKADTIRLVDRSHSNDELNDAAEPPIEEEVPE